MKKRLLSKLKSRVGESIGETLVSLLISSLALVMLAGAISAAANAINTSNDKMTDYYQQDARVAERSVDGAVTITITETAGGATPVTQPYSNVKYTKNDSFSGTPVVAYSQS